MARSLKKGDWGTDVLAVLAIASTLLTQEYLASLVVVIMTWTGEFIEYYAANKAKSELKLLKKLKPTIAHLKVEENLIDSPLENIKIGDIILIKSGEIIPTEGTIVEGVAVFDESSITGEVAPIRKAKGDKVLSGTKNGSTSFYMRVETDPKNSEYQKIIDLVANSLENKPKIVTLASQYSIFFSALSVIIALVAYLITNDVRTIAEVLVLATPCPLLIAAPVAFLGGINAGAKRGIIFKNSASLQTLSNMKTVAFD
ncbi:MAG: HAD-IC family P-type ATPase, partial [Bifidobacteriaceae bacterium]|nr:HAD-IC family P-type ATPase [Bifidobacteriaceae bacterium]